MSAKNEGIIINWRQAMPSDSPAVELEVVGSPSPSVTPCPAAAAHADADADSDHGGGSAEFSHMSDQELQVGIIRCEGMAKGILQRTPDGGEKMQLRILRMKKELERRRARQCKDDTVLRQAVQAKCTGGSRGEIFDFKSDDETMDSTPSKYYPNSSYTASTKTYTQVKGAAYKERSSLSHAKCAYAKNGGQISKESLSPQLKTCTHLPKNRTINELENSTGAKRINATFGSNGRSNLAKNKPSPSLKIKKDVVLLDDDDDTEPARSADVQISNKWDESKIHYPSSTDPEVVELSYSDMKCLEPEEYLESNVINFCLQYFKKSRPPRDLYMFSTYFYSKLEEALSTPGDLDSKFSKLRRWWRSVDIFKKAYIILPINELKHWSLIIVCMPTKEADSGPIMLHLDSLGIHSSQKLFDIVRRYIQAEWRHLQKDSSYDIPFSGRIWKHLSRNINGEKVEVPRQRNDYDCGIFMLYYIDRFIQEAPERLTKDGLGMFGRRWFDHKKASALREGIRQLLFDLFDSVLDDDGPSEPELHSGEDKDIRMAWALDDDGSSEPELHPGEDKDIRMA